MSVCSRGGHCRDGAVRPSAWPPVAAAAPGGRGVHRPGHQARAGGRPHRLGEMGPRARVEGSRLGQRPGGFGNVTRLAGLDYRHRKSGGGQRRHHSPLVAPRGFQDTQGGRHGLEPLHQGSHPDVIVGDGPPFTRGSQGHSQVGFGHINTNKPRRGRHHHS